MYRYCKLFSVSPMEYMDTPSHTIEWMLRLDDLHTKGQQPPDLPEDPGSGGPDQRVAFAPSLEAHHAAQTAAMPDTPRIG